MTIIARVSRLFKADVHAMLDVIEEPEALLKQAIREMEEEIAKDEGLVNRQKEELAQLVKTGGDLGRALAAIEEQLDLCFEQNNEELTKTIVRKKLETCKQKQRTGDLIQALETDLNKRKSLVEEEKEKLAALLEKTAIITAKERHVTCVFPEGAPAVAPEDVELAYLEEKKKRAAR